MENSKTAEGSSIFLCVLKGVISAIFLSLVGILVFALVIKLAGLVSGLIRPINQVIKGVSIFVGTFIGIRGKKEKALVKGILIGLSYTILSFIIFSVLNGSFAINKSLLFDVLFLSLMGAISGMICNFILKK